MGDRRPRDAPDSRASTQLAGPPAAADVRVVGALPGPAGVPGVERVRRHAAAVDRLVARRPHARGWSGRRRGATTVRELRARAAARGACAGRRSCGCAGATARHAGAPLDGRRADGAVRAARAPLPRARRSASRSCGRRSREGASGRRAAAPRGRDRASSPAPASRACAVPRAGAVRGALRRPRAARSATRARAAARRRDASPTSTPAGRCASAPCGAPARCRPGRRGCRCRRASFAPYLLRLRSAAPDPPARAAAAPGRVVDPGDAGARRVAATCGSTLREPAWLVLGAVVQRRLAGELRRPRPRRARRPSTASRWAGACPRAAATRGDGVRARPRRPRRLPRLRCRSCSRCCALVLRRAARRAPSRRPHELPDAAGAAAAGRPRRRCSRSPPAPCSASCSPPAPRR